MTRMLSIGFAGFFGTLARLSIGFCGGFTTFSTLAFETVQLAGGHQWWLATVNVIASIVLGLVAVWLGTAISRAI